MLKNFSAKNSNEKYSANMNIAAFIPVRGGSKSIPHKNIKLFCGKPLVYWTIKAACECALINKVYVATDSKLIRDIVNEFAFKKLVLISRSAENATDIASTESAMLEFAREIEVDHVVLIQATSPLLDTEDLDKGIRKYIEGEYDSLLSVVRQKRFVWEIRKNTAIPINYNPDSRPRRQEMSGFLVENGAFYITERKQLMLTKTRLSGKIGVYEMPEDTYFEIDEINDWIILEKIKWERIISDRKNIAVMEKINLLVCDVDGVLTDAGMYYNTENDELKKFHTRDGKGFELLGKLGIKIMLLTSEDTAIVKRRAEKLEVDFCFMGIKNKKEKLDDFLKKNREFSYENMAYIGDDLNDLEAMQCAAFSAAPQDAVSEVRRSAQYLCEKLGGNGCVREVCDVIRRLKK